MASRILGPIRDAYMALHTGAVPTQFSASNNTQNEILWEPSSYPLCNIPDHHPDLTSHTHDTSASTTLVRTVLHDNAALTLVSLTGPDASCSTITRRIDKSLTDVPPPDDDIYVPLSFYPAHQTAVENLHIAISQDPACMVQGGVDTSTTTISLSTSEPLAPTPPTSTVSTSPPIVVTVQHIADCSTYSEVLDVPSSPSPTPVLANVLPTGRQLSLDPSMTRPHASSPPEPHSSLLAPAAPGVHSCLLPLELDAATEGEGRVMAALHEKDPLDPPSAIREKIIAVIDPPTQSPPPSSVGGVAIAGPSWRSPGVRHTGDHPSHSLHGQFNIV
ncbi:hypothetical protein EDB89DRAFT_2004061 [Lactarius sanguifluus]|nr:hypothetical protein EDB89DRAFT_2004061 [Lactarius sanguifluus]